MDREDEGMGPALVCLLLNCENLEWGSISCDMPFESYPRLVMDTTKA